jgi:hypothetical protein
MNKKLDLNMNKKAGARQEHKSMNKKAGSEHEQKSWIWT